MGGLPDIAGPGLQVVSVGTSVGKHYCSDPANSSYRDLHAVGFTDHLLRPEQDRDPPRYALGLTDLAQNVVSSDDRTGARSPIGSADTTRS